MTSSLGNLINIQSLQLVSMSCEGYYSIENNGKAQWLIDLPIKQANHAL